MIPILLILVVLLPLSAKVGLVINYWGNQLEYLKSCENKDKPQLKCNGKCHLAKKMTLLTNEKSTEKPELPESLKFEFAAFYIATNFSNLFLVQHSQKKKVAIYKAPISSFYFKEIFHPPLV